MTLENILVDFQLLDDWEDRYRYVIELGRALPPAAGSGANGGEQSSRLRQSGLARDRGQWRHRRGRAVPHLQGRQRRPYRAGTDRHPLCDLLGPVRG